MDNNTNTQGQIFSVFFYSLAIFAALMFLLKSCRENYTIESNITNNPIATETKPPRQFIGLVNKPRFGPKQFNPDLGYVALYNQEPYLEYHNYATPMCE
jgi:hypothetical protein